MKLVAKNVVLVLFLLIPAGMTAQTWHSTGGPPFAMLNAVAVDPGNPNVVYCAGGGLYKSVDGGDHWVKVAATSNAVIVNPLNGGTIVADNLKSTDSGATFTAMPIPTSAGAVTALTYVPGDTNTIFAGTSHGSVYLSIDAGTSWVKSAVGLDTCTDYCPINSILVSAESTNVVFAGSLYKSSTSGALWEPVMGFPTSQVVADPAAAHSFYAGTSLGLYHTSDNGESWGLFGVPQFDVRCIVIDPHDPNTIYIGTPYTGVWKTTNGGGTWLEENFGIPGASLAMGTRALAIADDDSGTVFRCTEIGIYRSTNAGGTWTYCSNGFADDGVHSLVVTPTGSRFAGTQEGVYRQGLHQEGWQFIGGGIIGAHIAVDPRDDEHLVQGLDTPLGGAIQTSTDGGITWPGSSPTLDGSPTEIHFAPSSSKLIFTTAPDSGLKSTDGGFTWLSLHLPPATISISISPDNAGYVLAAGNGNLYTSTDTGKTWTTRHIFGNIQSIRLAYSASAPYQLFAALNDSGIFRSFDDGETWEDLHFPLSTVAFRGINADIAHGTILVGTADDGVYYSTDAGSTWRNRNAGLPSLNVRAIAIEPPHGALVSLAGVNGVYAVDTLLTGIKGDIARVEKPEGFVLYLNYPNPFNPSTTIRYHLPADARVQVRIFNMLGQQITDLGDGLQDSGDNEIRWNAGGLASGVYFYSIEATASSGEKVWRGAGKMVLAK